MNNIYATPLPFELTVPLRVWRSLRQVKTEPAARLVDLVFEPPIYDGGPMTPSFVFATWAAGKEGYEASCILPPDTDPATLTAEFLAGREWSAGHQHRFKDHALRCPLDYQRSGESAAAALSRAGAPVSRRAVFDFQRRRREAVAALEVQWIEAEAERLARDYRSPDETPAERAANDTRDIAAALAALLKAGQLLANMGATTIALVEQITSDAGGPTPGREDAFWLAGLAKDAAGQAARLASVYARYQDHCVAVLARIRRADAQP